MSDAGEASRRWNRPHLAQRMAQPRHLRASSGRVWPVPLVHAVVEGTIVLVGAHVSPLVGTTGSLRADWAGVLERRHVRIRGGV